MNLKVFIVFILAYLMGAIPTSIITCKALKGIDIRKYGSGNAGATNVYRVMGFKVAFFVLCMDALKGVFGVFAPSIFLKNPTVWHSIGSGLCAILGHIWTIFARFKGGKGVGTSLGVFLALLPFPAIIALVVWTATVVITRIVSVSSILAGFVLAGSTIVFYNLGKFQIELPLVYFAVAIALLIIVTHSANIKRLINGTENKIGVEKKE